MIRLTLFYSWQSDHDSGIGRRFVRTALEEASRALHAEGIEILIDSDTAGAPGTPPVSETILKKILGADLFLADMSLVSQTPDGKHAPNPNVLIEYGYALRAMGHERILLVMNTAFGDPGLLPFDLRHLRHPMRYHAPEALSDTERHRVRKDFSERLAAALRTAAKNLRDSPRLERDDESHEQAESLIHNALGMILQGQAPAVVPLPRMILHAAPYAAFGQTRAPAKLVGSIAGTFAPPTYERLEAGSGQQTWWTRDPPLPVPDKPNPESRWCVSFYRPGLLQCILNLGKRIGTDPTILIEGKKLEAWIVQTADRMSQWSDGLGLSGPTLMTLTLEGFEDVDISPGRGGILRPRTHWVRPPSQVVNGNPTGHDLQPLLDEMWVAFGKGDGSPSFGSGTWDGYAGVGDYRLE